MRKIDCCNGCTERYDCCHDTCKRYKDAKAEQDVIHDKQVKEAIENRIIRGNYRKYIPKKTKGIK